MEYLNVKWLELMIHNTGRSLRGSSEHGDDRVGIGSKMLGEGDPWIPPPEQQSAERGGAGSETWLWVKCVKQPGSWQAPGYNKPNNITLALQVCW